MKSSTALRWLKRLMIAVACAALLALAAVAMPFAWMDAIHRRLGLGPMPAEPIAEYLARSLSAYYAYFGALFLYLAFHLPRNVAFVRFLALAGIAWGAIDALAALASGLPACWTVNGAFGGAFCAAVWLLARRIDPSPDRESDPHDPA